MWYLNGHTSPECLTMACYWVFAGEYESTDFNEMAEGRVEERYGPFETLGRPQGYFR